MAGLDDLSRGDFGDILRRLRVLETASPLQNASIGANGLRVYDGGMITIENGGLRVTGTAEIIGRLFASGQVVLVGEVVISGPLDVSGDADVSGVMTVLNDLIIAAGGKLTAGSIELNPDGSAKFGNMAVSPEGKITSGTAEINPDGSAKFGTLQISKAGKITSGSAEVNPDGSVKFGTFEIDTQGRVKINADVTVNNGGKIKAGGLTVEPTLFGGSVQFENGGYLSGPSSGPQLTGPVGNAFVYVRNALAGIQAAAIELIGNVKVQGGLRVTDPGTAAGATANVHMDAQGNLRRIT